MLTIDFKNLIYFVPQYLASSAIAILIFFYLERRFSNLGLSFHMIRRPRRDLTRRDFLLCTPLDYNNWFTPVYDLAFLYSGSPDSSGSGLASRFQNAKKNTQVLSYDLDYIKGKNFGIAPSTRLYKSEIYNNHIIYKILASIYAISAWIGMLLVLTPYSRIQIFIPHFSSSTNLLVAIILGIAIFEATISIIVFFTGNSRKWFIYVEGLVFIVTSLFFFSPSMSWLYSFSVPSRLLIYVILPRCVLFLRNSIWIFYSHRFL
ncbi:MAG: hypothetical protein M1431_05805 [Candidatus Thermoplasmatota archaeon]|nr:hypothetical protein [Candidatus Thermoplasmatota archaeon]